MPPTEEEVSAEETHTRTETRTESARPGFEKYPDEDTVHRRKVRNYFIVMMRSRLAVWIVLVAVTVLCLIVTWSSAERTVDAAKKAQIAAENAQVSALDVKNSFVTLARISRHDLGTLQENIHGDLLEATSKINQNTNDKARDLGLAVNTVKDSTSAVLAKMGDYDQHEQIVMNQVSKLVETNATSVTSLDEFKEKILSELTAAKAAEEKSNQEAKAALAQAQAPVQPAQPSTMQVPAQPAVSSASGPGIESPRKDKQYWISTEVPRGMRSREYPRKLFEEHSIGLSSDGQYVGATLYYNSGRPPVDVMYDVHSNAIFEIGDADRVVFWSNTNSFKVWINSSSKLWMLFH